MRLSGMAFRPPQRVVLLQSLHRQQKEREAQGLSAEAPAARIRLGLARGAVHEAAARCALAINLGRHKARARKTIRWQGAFWGGRAQQLRTRVGGHA